MSLRYVTLGGIVLDSVLSSTGEFSPAGCGGNAMYSAASIRLWSDGVAAVGRAARDFPQTYLEDFARAGVDVSAVRWLDEPHERHSHVKFDSEGNRTSYNASVSQAPDKVNEHSQTPAYVRYGSSPAAATEPVFDPVPADLPADYWQARGFHVAPMSHAAQMAWAHELAARKILFTVDPGRNTTGAQIGELLRLTPVFLPSQEDVVRMFGQIEMEQAIRQLAEMGPRVVGIKLGRRGSIVYDRDSATAWRIPVYPTDGKDPTGAGDSYCGGFLVGWVETGEALEAALRATASASFVVEDFDARYALRFSRQDAEARVRKLRLVME